MRRTTAVAVALTGLIAWPAGAPAAGVAPAPGSLRIGPHAADPAGGAPWTVRSWRRPGGDGGVPARPVRCLQVGRLEGTRLVRTVRGATRPLGWRHRTVCGRVDAGAESPPLVVERLLGDPAAPPLQTIVAGRARPRDHTVRLWVAGVPRDLSLDRSRAYLAVLPGTVRRAELAVELHGADVRRIGLDRGDEYDPLVPGTVRRAFTQPALDGGPDVALTAFERGSTCVEVGRVLAGEAGRYDPRWDVFLDAPALAWVNGFEDGAPPVIPSGTCTDPRGDLEPSVVRLGPSSVAVAGVAPPSVTGIELRYRGAAVPVELGSGAVRPFLVQLPSTGALGERLRIVVTRAGGRVERGTIWLGDQDRPVRFTRYGARGRRLRIAWFGGAVPPGGVTVTEGAHRVRVRLTERYSPTFSNDGTPIVYPLVGIGRCVDLRLRRPLGDRRVVDATSGRAAEPGPWPRRCRVSRR